MSAEGSFAELKNSFFYGKRSDLSFKFLEHMEEEDAAAFLQHLFSSIIDGIDAGDLNQIKSALIEGQTGGYERQKNFAYDSGPFTPLRKEIKDLKLTLITSSGHFVEGDDPQPFGVVDMTQEEAERRIFESIKEKPLLSEIPYATTPGKLRVRHGGYDIRAARLDANVVFPWQRLVEIAEQNQIGSLTINAYSFVGACSQKRLLNETLPDWINTFPNSGAEAALLVPV